MSIFDKLFGKSKDKNVYEPPVTSASGKIELDVPEDLFKEEFRSQKQKKSAKTTKTQSKKDSSNKSATKAKTNQNKTESKKNATKSQAVSKNSATTTKAKASYSTKRVSVKNDTSNKKQSGVAKQLPATAKENSTGYFEIKSTKDDRYVFNLYAANHLIIATSQAYSSAQSALTGIKSVIANYNAPVEDQTLKNAKELPYPKWEIYLDSANEYRFRLSASNGNTVCHSQGYNQKSGCKNGIKSVQKFAPTAKIEKDYLKKD